MPANSFDSGKARRQIPAEKTDDRAAGTVIAPNLDYESTPQQLSFHRLHSHRSGMLPTASRRDQEVGRGHRANSKRSGRQCRRKGRR